MLVIFTHSPNLTNWSFGIILNHCQTAQIFTRDMFLLRCFPSRFSLRVYIQPKYVLYVLCISVLSLTNYSSFNYIFVHAFENNFGKYTKQRSLKNMNASPSDKKDGSCKLVVAVRTLGTRVTDPNMFQCHLRCAMLDGMLGAEVIVLWVMVSEKGYFPFSVVINLFARWWIKLQKP